MEMGKKYYRLCIGVTLVSKEERCHFDCVECLSPLFQIETLGLHLYFETNCKKLWLLSYTLGLHFILSQMVNLNGYQSSIKMAPYEALYGRKCRTSLYWTDVSERKPETCLGSGSGLNTLQGSHAYVGSRHTRVTGLVQNRKLTNLCHTAVPRARGLGRVAHTAETHTRVSIRVLNSGHSVFPKLRSRGHTIETHARGDKNKAIYQEILPPSLTHIYTTTHVTNSSM
ncbi:reverse transcriptase [Gossypium australe]|uniref:Reverse transcriptase n=1 Tax=Gossypium australe TaxID=47621 RepID=A0A5B6VNX1_9ROSI|nr:reverse transcriptase [Gossypium australe]